MQKHVIFCGLKRLVVYRHYFVRNKQITGPNGHPKHHFSSLFVINLPISLNLEDGEYRHMRYIMMPFMR